MTGFVHFTAGVIKTFSRWEFRSTLEWVSVNNYPNHYKINPLINRNIQYLSIKSKDAGLKLMKMPDLFHLRLFTQLFVSAHPDCRSSGSHHEDRKEHTVTGMWTGLCLSQSSLVCLCAVLYCNSGRDSTSPPEAVRARMYSLVCRGPSRESPRRHLRTAKNVFRPYTPITRNPKIWI